MEQIVTDSWVFNNTIEEQYLSIEGDVGGCYKTAWLLYIRLGKIKVYK